MARINNSIRNLVTSLTGQFLTVILGFASRTVFINTLGEQYLGVNGLFGNIINMLSLSELGIGTAIIYSLYKPIADSNQKEIYLLMKFYKIAYRIIGLIVAVLGLLMTPFLTYLIKDMPPLVNIYLIFSLFLVQNLSSYFFFAYKSALLRAHQKQYIITVVGYVFVIISNIAQILVLYYLNNYLLYLLVVIIFQILQNFIISQKVNQMYPYINEKSKHRISKQKAQEILRNCYALFLLRINAIVLNATDNLVLSGFVGLSAVGLYSNYILITSHIRNILSLFYSSITASLGNLHTFGDTNHEVLVFQITNFLAFLFYGVASIGIFIAANPFIELWIGADFLLPMPFVFLLSIDLYLNGIKKVSTTFRDSMGLFLHAKYRPLVGAVINLVLSVVLVKPLGITGIILGTVIANLTTYFWLDPKIVFNKGFHRSSSIYYIKNGLYLLVLGVTGFLVYWLVPLIKLEGWLRVFALTVLCVALPSAIFLAVFWRQQETRYLVDLFKKLIWTRFKNTLLKK